MLYPTASHAPLDMSALNVSYNLSWSIKAVSFLSILRFPPLFPLTPQPLRRSQRIPSTATATEPTSG